MPESKWRLYRANDNWVVSPDLPLLPVCGGVQNAYYPELSAEELAYIRDHPDSGPDEVDAAARELARRRGREGGLAPAPAERPDW